WRCVFERQIIDLQPAALELLDEEPLTVFFRRAIVTTELLRPRDPSNGFRMSPRLLPQVEARERQSERGDAAKDVGKTASCDETVACVLQRLQTHPQRLLELARGEVRPGCTGRRV